jgi:uncharacterized protein (DUF2345 family)
MLAPADIVLGSVSTASEGRITSTLGSILDGGDTDPELSGGSFALRAANGIGVSNPLDTEITTVAYNNTQSGNVLISNRGGITIDSVDGLTSSSNVGDTVITATSPITFAVDATQATVLLQALESALETTIMSTINAGVEVVATTGNIVVEAGDRIVMASGSLVSRPGRRR